MKRAVAQARAFDDILRNASDDPLQFEPLLDAWRQKAEQLVASGSDLEDVALTTIEATLQAIGSNYLGERARIIELIENLPNPAFVVQRDGRLITTNKPGAAVARAASDGLDWFDYDLDGDEPVQRILDALLSPQRNDTGGLIFRRGYRRATGTVVSLAFSTILSPVADQIDALVIFVIEPLWSGKVIAMLSQVHALTQAETSVLESFLGGMDLKAIAQERGRSLATIRTQFQTVLDKTGARGQADLLRVAIALTQFVETFEPVADAAAHPYRKRFELIRPGARRVEVVLAGDFTGETVLFIPDITQFTFQPEFEARMKAAGICMVSVARPGHGRTDPPPDNEAYDTCLLGDLKAVQDQLGVESSVLFAKNMSGPLGFRLGGMMGDRISKIVLASPVLPPQYVRESRPDARWSASLRHAMTISPKVFLIIVRLGMKAWRALGTRRMCALQFRRFKPDLEFANRIDTIKEMDDAFEAFFATDERFAEHDLEFFFRDWTEWVTANPAPVVMFCGCMDQTNTIDIARRFAADFNDSVTLDEVPDGGFMSATMFPERLAEHFLRQ